MILEKNILKQFFPYAGSIVVLFGFIKQLLYYNYFGINIENYLSLTEILTLFLKDILIYIGVIVVILLIRFFVESKKEVEKYSKIRSEIAIDNSFKGRLKLHFKLLAELFLFSGFVLLHNVFNFIWRREIFWDNFLTTLIIPIMLIGLVMILEFRNKYIQLYKKDINITVYNIFVVIFMFSIFAFSNIRQEIKKIESKTENIFSFKYNNIKHITNNEIKLLG